LLSQVKNTMPYLFEETSVKSALGSLPPAHTLKDYARQEGVPLSHYEYFRLCVSSHFLSCATPVPTDVDNQIRHKLWPAKLPLDEALKMVALVLEIRGWDLPVLSSRYVYGAPGTPWATEALSGHLGEWFTVASAAYCALKQYKDPAAHEWQSRLFAAIEDEVNRHSEIFGSLWKAKDGIGSLKAAATIAHNFGDLDRVMDMWSLDVADPLRLKFYKLTATPFDPDKKLRYLGRLWSAGELYKSEIGGSSMALENHRHFALRKPRCLRRSAELLIPIGPFFDDWGRRVAQALIGADCKPTEDFLEVIEALRHGWGRLPKTVGYGRALMGMIEVCPELRVEELLKQHATRAVLEMPQEQFEKKWNESALAELDDIPSRA
jgi:hypothetical protein